MVCKNPCGPHTVDNNYFRQTYLSCSGSCTVSVTISSSSSSEPSGLLDNKAYLIYVLKGKVHVRVHDTVKYSLIDLAMFLCNVIMSVSGSFKDDPRYCIFFLPCLVKENCHCEASFKLYIHVHCTCIAPGSSQFFFNFCM